MLTLSSSHPGEAPCWPPASFQWLVWTIPTCHYNLHPEAVGHPEALTGGHNLPVLPKPGSAFPTGLQAQRPAQPTRVFRASHPPPLTPDPKVPCEADVFRPLAFFLFSTNFQHQLEAAIKTPGLAVLRLSISTWI